MPVGLHRLMMQIQVPRISILHVVDPAEHSRVSGHSKGSKVNATIKAKLAYSYIPCTDASWPASFDDADSGTPDQHPARR
ncbi:hypothetical protein MTR67_042921 [Solanum verrucosum]|uniref:Late blight resistance protein n=1 Tax=Solanum verrucosum TaxID=315347 RepID=A0AAF0UQB9_SOLVR|nr:hypothetical protein MTR67_042921 [Solanum verrucosum]